MNYDVQSMGPPASSVPLPLPEAAAIVEKRYREQASRAYLTKQPLKATGPGAWAIFGAAMSVFVTLTALSIFGKVEGVSAAAVGRLQVRGGRIPIYAAANGRVTAVLVHVGEAVSSNQVLIRLDSNSPPHDVVGVLSPRKGVVEMLAVHPGEAIMSAQLVAELLPGDEPLEVISFLPERARPLVELGQEVRLQAGPLLKGPGGLRAKVAWISGDVVSRGSFADIFGEGLVEGPVYLVHLELVQDDRFRELAPHLWPGMRVRVRYPSPKRRAISLILDPMTR